MKRRIRTTLLTTLVVGLAGLATVTADAVTGTNDTGWGAAVLTGTYDTGWGAPAAGTGTNDTGWG